jgi:hypothetical protein
VDYWFENERLPYELGWTPPLAQTNLVTLAVKITEIVALANDEVLEGFLITASRSFTFHVLHCQLTDALSATLRDLLSGNATSLPSLPSKRMSRPLLR